MMVNVSIVDAHEVGKETALSLNEPPLSLFSDGLLHRAITLIFAVLGMKASRL